MQHCLKQVVKATIMCQDNVIAVGYNDIQNDEVTECPRKDMPTGEGYELCRDTCKQQGHAEIQAVNNLSEGHYENCYLVLEGHTYVCDPCKQALYRKGITEFVIR